MYIFQRCRIAHQDSNDKLVDVHTSVFIVNSVQSSVVWALLPLALQIL